jgi:hypothetical protein
MRRRNRHCGRRDIECWTEQTTMLLAKGRMGTEEGQRSGMSRRYLQKRINVHLTSFRCR